MAPKMITDRNDRLDPLFRHDYVAQQHLLRYMFACEQLKSQEPLKVLDIACGTGFGTQILRQNGLNAVGADLDRSQIAVARETWGDYFQYADVLNLPFEDNSFEAVVSFETVEHVMDGNKFMTEMRRVLKPDGVLICSTPNIRYTSHPPYHLLEYEPEAFFALVEQNFAEVARYGQYFHLSNRLQDLWQWYIAAYIMAFRNKLLRSNSSSPTNRVGELTLLTNELDVETNPYRVQPYKSDAWLRIMITVAR